MSQAYDPILLINSEFTIKCDRSKLYAKYHDGSLMRIRRFEHVDDLFDISLRGLVKLAMEFSEELTASKENPHPGNGL